MKTIPSKMLGLLLATLLNGCGSLGVQAPVTNSGLSDAPFSTYVVDEAVMGKWARSCALCHITGEAGAPKVGDRAQWQIRLEQGEQVVLEHVLNGFNSMPPLGYCMACEVSDFQAMIAYMAGTTP
jgi:cytochrome c5